MIDADGEAIAHPIVQAPVVKHFVIDHPNEFCLTDLEWMFELQPVAITPRVDLRFAPASLEPVATIESELAEWHAQVRADCAALFPFMPAVRWSGLTMKI